MISVRWYPELRFPIPLLVCRISLDQALDLQRLFPISLASTTEPLIFLSAFESVPPHCELFRSIRLLK